MEIKQTHSGQTYSMLKTLIDPALLAQNHEHQNLVVSAPLAGLKQSTVEDFANMLNSLKIPFKWNKTESTFLIGNSIIKFVSASN